MSIQHSPVRGRDRRKLTEDECAAYLRVSKRTLQRWRVLGTGPRFAKYGTRVIYDGWDVDQWSDSNTFQSTSEARS
jgi:hypothetical protein